MLTSNMNLIKGCMLVGITELFDLRLGTIAAHFGMQAYKQVLESGYFSRTQDVFAGIDPQEYEKAYKQKDARVLSLSTITQVPELVKDFVKKVNTVSVSTPVQVGVPRIDVNFHGFDFPQEVIENILHGLRIYVGERCIIEDVNYSIADLTPEFTRLSYDHVVMYDISQWLEYHAQTGAWKSGGCPTVTMFLPILQHGNVLEEGKDIIKESEHFMEVMSPVVNILMLPAEVFSSAFNPALLDKKTPSPETEVPSEVSSMISPHPEVRESPQTSQE